MYTHSNADCHSYPIDLLERRPCVQEHANGEQHACKACRVESRLGPSRLEILAANELSTISFSRPGTISIEKKNLLIYFLLIHDVADEA